MTQSKQSKLEQSKSEYGTLTAKMDANNDYSSSTSGTSATSSTSANMSELSKLAQQSQTTSSTSTTGSANNSKQAKANQTLTAKYDVNGDYSAE
ncbi:hypothetical protein SRRS_22150 [Sporomusa rhizae]|uniref:hypothetical protein n=1 Tax=Sporomusa rhizae TaxID=357999 RepID=UPI00352A22D3